MTDWDELQPLLDKWKQTSLLAALVIGVCLIVYPSVPTTPAWTVMRYVIMRICAFAVGMIAFPGGMIVFDVLTPGGSFLARIGEAKYGPAILSGCLCIAMAMLLCFV